MKQIIKLTESDLRKIVQSVLNESFENQELTDMVKEHGGLDTSQAEFDARYNNHELDLQQAQAKAYIPREIWEKIHWTLDSNYPIKQQTLRCNDGGVIVLDMYKGLGKSQEFIDKKKARLHNHWDNVQYSHLNKEDMDTCRRVGHELTDKLGWYNQYKDPYTSPNYARRDIHGNRRGVKKVRGQK